MPAKRFPTSVAVDRVRVHEQAGKPQSRHLRLAPFQPVEFVPWSEMFATAGIAEISEEGILTVRIDNVRVTKRIKEKPPFIGEKKVLFGIRPQDIMVSKEPGADKIEGKISLVQVFGSEILLTVDVDQTSIRAIAERKLAVKEGETIYLSFDEERIFIFD